MKDLLSLSFYLAVFIVSVLCFYKSGTTSARILKKGYVSIGLLLPALVAAFRYRVGVDYDSYVTSATELWNTPWKEFFSGSASYFEPTMYIISKITFAGENRAILFFGVYAAITIGFFYLAAKRYSIKNWWVIMMLYLLVIFSPSLNAVRQFASVALTFFASTYIIKTNRKSWLKFFIFMGIAYLFHNSALIVIIFLPVLYFMTRCDSNKSRFRITIRNITLAILIYISIRSFFLFIPEIPVLEKYKGFVYDANILVNHPPNPIVKIAPILISSIFYNRLNRINKDFPFYFSTLFVALALSFAGDFIPQGYRLADYFTPYYFVIFASLIDISKRRKLIYGLCVFVYAMIYFVYSSYINNSYMTFPYRLILEGLV